MSDFLARAQAHLAGGRAGEAAALLEEGLAQHPDDVAARVALGQAYTALGRRAEAQRELLRANSLLAGTPAEFPNLDAYLNQLLEASPRPGNPDVTEMPGDRWGQRIKHPFLLMWALLVVAALGVGGWWVLKARERAEMVAARVERAHDGFLAGGAEDLVAAATEASRALDADPGSLDALSALAAARALALYLHGDGQVVEVGTTVAAARQRIKASGDGAEGARRDLLVAEAALALGALGRGLDARAELAEARIGLDHAADKRPDDALIVWLDGAVCAGLGDRERAEKLLEAARAAPPAAAALAELQLDGERFDAAAALFAGAARLPVAAAERELALAAGGKPLPAPRARAGRAAAWANLARFYATGSPDALREAAQSGVVEPRFLAWLALAQIDAGLPGEAQAARARLRAPDASALTPLVDAELAIAAGRPDDALKLLGTAGGEHARRIRARALDDAGHAAQAAAERQGLAAEDLGATTYRYRVQTRLAEEALAAGKLADAEAAARAALVFAPAWPPAHAVLGRILLARGDAAGAGSQLQAVVDAGRATVADELAYAQAATALGHPDLARAALGRARDKGAPPEALGEKPDPKRPGSKP